MQYIRFFQYPKRKTAPASPGTAFIDTMQRTAQYPLDKVIITQSFVKCTHFFKKGLIFYACIL